MLKRKTVVLLNGKDAYIVSCIVGEDGVDANSPHSIVMGLRENKVKAIGMGVNVNGKLSHVVDMDNNPITCPNRALRLNILDVEVRRSLGALIAVSAKEPVVSEAGWHTVPFTVHCANCGEEIRGTKRVKGSAAQVFKPNSNIVTNQGKSWYCGCTTRPAIPEKYKAVTANELIGYLQQWLVDITDNADVSSADVGSLYRVIERSKDFVKKAR